MAAYTSKATGNLSAAGQTTWNEVGSPVSGSDTFTVTSGHTVTVDIDVTAGASPVAGTAAATVNGNLTIAAGKTLTCRGDLQWGSGAKTLTMGAGSVIEFDGSVSGVAYNLRFNYINNWIVNGTSGSPAIVRSNAGGPPGAVTILSNQSSGQWDLTNLKLLRMGSDTASAIYVNPVDSSANRALFTDVTLDTCGQLQLKSAHVGSRVELIRVKHVNSVGSTNVGNGLATTICAFIQGLGTPTTGTRIFTSCVYDLPVGFVGMGYLNYTYPIFLQGFLSSTGSAASANFDKAFLRCTATYPGPLPLQGSASNCYSLADGPINNWHAWQYVSTAQFADYSITGCVWDSSTLTNDGGGSAGDTGEMVNMQNPSVTRTHTFTGNITLPSMGTQVTKSYKAEMGGLTSNSTAGGSQSTHLVKIIEHNTVYTALTDGGYASSIAQVGESGTPTANEIASVKSNIIWGPSAAGGNVVKDVGGTGYSPYAITDVVVPGAATNNCTYNTRAGYASNPTGYDYKAGATLPGANDVSVNPGFVDSTRNLASWAVSLGSVSGTDAGKVADGIAYLVADPTRMDSLLAHVRAGQAPTNALLATAAHDGTTIGAVAYVSVAVTTRRGCVTPTRGGR